MRTLLLISAMTLSSSCFAITQAEMDRNVIAADMDAACRGMASYGQNLPLCQGLQKRMKTGHLVSESQYNDYCGSMAKLRPYIEEKQREYKKMTGKKIDYNKCDPSTFEGIRPGDV